MDTRLDEARLYGIVDRGYVQEADVAACARELLAGGVRILQLRAKNLPQEDVARLAHVMQPICREANAVFVLNDYPELAASIGADAVHVGQDAPALADIRRIVGPRMLIGRSTHSLDQVRRAREERADYIGFGLRDIAQAQKLAGDMPMFCIGGVNADTLPQVLAAGAQRVVVVSWLLQQTDRTQAARQLLHALTPA